MTYIIRRATPIHKRCYDCRFPTAGHNLCFSCDYRRRNPKAAKKFLTGMQNVSCSKCKFTFWGDSSKPAVKAGLCSPCFEREESERKKKEHLAAVKALRAFGEVMFMVGLCATMRHIRMCFELNEGKHEQTKGD